MLDITEEQLVAPIALDVARQTLAERLPDTSIEDVQYLPGGGSFSVFSLNRQLVARFPKFLTGHEEFRIVEEQFYFEKSIMDHIYASLAPHEVARPLSLLTGPSEGFAGPVLCYEIFTGTPINRLGPDREQLSQLATLLGDFLSRLHGIERSSLVTLGLFDTEPEHVKQSWFDSFERNRQTTFQLLDEQERTWFTRLYEHFLQDADTMEPSVTFCHGDCSNENVMLSSDCSHLQIIDWDDMVIDDAARDFCEWLGYFGVDFLQQTLAHYTLPVDRSFIERAKFYYCRIPLLYFAMAQQYESSRFLDFARRKYRQNLVLSQDQGWFSWS